MRNNVSNQNPRIRKMTASPALDMSTVAEPKTEAQINAEHAAMTRVEVLKVEAGLAFQCPVQTKAFLNQRDPMILDGDSPLMAAAEDAEGLKEALNVLRRTPEFIANRPALAKKLNLV